MTTLTITEISSGAKLSFLPAMYNIYLDNQIRGTISSRSPELTINEVPAGKHTVQVRNGLLAGMSAPLNIDIKGKGKHSIQVSKIPFLRIAFFLAFIAVYFIMRVTMQMPIGIAAVSGAIFLAGMFALFPTIRLTQPTSPAPGTGIK